MTRLPCARHQRELAWIALLIFVWLAAAAWARPLMLPDEGRYVGVAWEMLRSGDWLTPTLNGLPFFHKPPLFYWITAASMWVFGPSAIAARAAPLLGAGLGAMTTYLFVRRWVDERAARLTLVALLVQPLFYLGGQFANLDMLVAGCITATIVLFAHAALGADLHRPVRGTLVAAYSMAAIGVLAKGLIGAVIPALVIGAWLILRRRWRVIAVLVWAPGVLIFLAIAAPWFVAMQWRFDGFLDYFFVVQHFKRFAAGGFNNAQPFWFYPAVLLVLSLPWLPWLWRTLRRGLARGGAGDKSGDGAGGSAGDATRDAVRLLAVVWAAAVVGFFSLPQSKLVGYILPAVPPLAFLMAESLSKPVTSSRHTLRLWGASAAVSAAVGLGVVSALAIHPLRTSRGLATALAAQRDPRDAVLLLDNYYYDVPFYAGLRSPVDVVDDWAHQDVRLRDNWRKELVDAATFAPAPAASRLVVAQALPATLCAARVSWLIGAKTAAADHPVLALARVAFTGRELMLWRLDTAEPRVAMALRCPGTPSAGSPDR